MTDDLLSQSDARTKGIRIWGYASLLGNQVPGALVTTGSLSFGYMFFNDYIAPPPDLTGRWKFTVVYEDTAYDKFKDLQITYQVLLVQKGLGLFGHGEKLSDRSPKTDPVDYIGDRRTNIKIRGTLTRNYLSRDTLLLHYDEMGSRRESGTIHRLVLCGTDTLCGCFQSTVADTAGSVRWERRSSLNRLYEPVKKTDNCRDSGCLAEVVQCQ